MTIHPSNYPPIIKPRKLYEKAAWAVAWLVFAASALASAGFLFWLLYFAERYL